VTAALGVQNLTKDYPPRSTGLLPLCGRGLPVRALEGVTVSLAAGSEVALVGPNGSGKTSLLRLCAATIVPSQGAVEIDGIPVRDPKQARARVGLADGTGLSPRISAAENLRLAATMYDVPVPETRIAELAESLQISSLLAARTQTLSQGEKARLCLARALLHRPRLLLVDELFSALDPGAATRLRGELFRLGEREGLATVVATHELTLARTFARLWVLDRGRLVAEGTFPEVEPRLDALFGAARAP
jgi:ABC-type multidrug transport system ATPase subunit